MRSIVFYLARNVTSMYYRRCLHVVTTTPSIPLRPDATASHQINQIIVLTVNCGFPAPDAAHTRGRKFTKRLGQEQLDSTPIIVQPLHLFPPPILPLLVDVTKRVKASESGFQRPPQVFLPALRRPNVRLPHAVHRDRARSGTETESINEGHAVVEPRQPSLCGNLPERPSNV